METLLMFFIFATVLLLFYSFYLLAFEQRVTIKTRLKQTSKSLEEYHEEQDKKQNGLLKGLLRSMIRYVEKSNYYSRIRTKLVQAYTKMKPIEFIEISIMAGLFLGFVLWMLTNHFFLALLGFVVAFRVPEMLLETIRKKRSKKLNDQLPQALSLISNGLRAGFSFPQAMAVVGREMEAPIADEFAKVLRDNSYGKNMDEALMDLGKRTEDEDLDIFITTLLIHLQVGGDLSEILDTISETIRERVKLKGDIRTMIAQSQMSAVIIGVLPIAIAAAMFVINPAYIGKLFQDSMGLMMLGIAGAMIFFGAFILTRIVKVKI
ncbi:type II secretion system F family protein [Trichococcus ilyis]|uniref:Tight adherence protein B n=1 Tax=Trichococcus ilyis TaxID=640938 RepID=A0A143Z811_9LACT|nr:type II secretion system F family protein [Trichococcus ilyis]CZR10343.1 type ii secretion system (t2ss) protein f [Trichococcus ilyis]SEJ95281.1 tight adherence protein B [Trichococcus ilyis]